MPSLLRIYVFVLVLLVLQSCLLSKVDRRPYQQMPYYTEMQRRMAALDIQGPGEDSAAARHDTLRAGWAKVNITPAEPISLAGYNRLGRKYHSVHDSLYVRVFVFANHGQKRAIVTADMLIFPPTLVSQLTRDLPGIGWQIGELYMSATHTHSGAGGWGTKLVGRLIAGRYRPQEVKRLSRAILRGIQAAAASQAPARIGFGMFDAASAVNNRLVDTGGTRDTLLQVIKVVKPSGETGLITAFSAHATVLPGASYTLSRDYPGVLVDALEELPGVSMAAYCAGAVGSHSPQKLGHDDLDANCNLGHYLVHLLKPQLDRIEPRYQFLLRSASVPLALREPQWKIGKDTRLRPWVFYWLYGRYPASLTALQIGSILMLGTPCDYSGELMAELRPLAVDNHLNLMVTSFNGGYIGYITKDEYYDVDHFETRAMNWFGPYNGAYITEMMGRMIRKFEKKD